MGAISAPAPPLDGLGERARRLRQDWLGERGELIENPPAASDLATFVSQWGSPCYHSARGHPQSQLDARTTQVASITSARRSWQPFGSHHVSQRYVRRLR